MNNLFGVQAAIQYFEQPLTVYRDAGGALDVDTGVFTRDNSEEVDILGTVVNATFKDMQTLPEGERVEGMIKLYTKTPISVSDADGCSDILAWGDHYYKAVQSLYREIGGFYRVLLKRYNKGDDDGF